MYVCMMDVLYVYGVDKHGAGKGRRENGRRWGRAQRWLRGRLRWLSATMETSLGMAGAGGRDEHGTGGCCWGRRRGRAQGWQRHGGMSMGAVAAAGDDDGDALRDGRGTGG